MAKTLILDNPTGSELLIADTGQWVNNGESVVVENDELADALLRNPIWKEEGADAPKSRKTKKVAAEGEGENE